MRSPEPDALPLILTHGCPEVARIVVKFRQWTDPTAELPEDAVDRDRLLTKSDALVAHRHGGFVGQQPHETAPAGVHWSEFTRGGHFAAMEAPDLLVGDVREFFGTLRDGSTG